MTVAVEMSHERVVGRTDHVADRDVIAELEALFVLAACWFWTAAERCSIP